MLAEQFLCGYNEPKLLQTRFLGQSLRGRMQNISFRCSGVSLGSLDFYPSLFLNFLPSRYLAPLFFFSCALTRLYFHGKNGFETRFSLEFSRFSSVSLTEAC